MTEPIIAPPVVEHPAVEHIAETPEAPPAKRPLMALLSPLALLVLAVAIGVVWLRTTEPPNLGDTEQRLTLIEARLSRLEQPRLEQPPLAQPLIEQPRPPQAANGPDLTPRIEALERRPSPDLAPLQARIAGLEQRPPNDTEALIARVAMLEKAAARDDRLSRVQAAAVALAAGRKLGTIPGAPPALARFADANPPTEAALRLAFPAAERAALDASRPPEDGQSVLQRMLVRAEELVTVRQGDRVLVGDPAAGVLLRARISLEAGDLAATVAALSDLRGPSAVAMSPWLAGATALRDARAALADMAALL